MSLGESLVNAIYKAAKAAATRKSPLLPTTAAGLAFVSTAMALAALASVKIDSAIKLPRLLTEQASMAISLPIIACGILLALWSASEFVRAQGTPVPIRPPQKLVTTGPYAHARNPMVLGYFTTMFGVGLLLGSPSLTLIFVPAFVLLMTLWIKKVEEPELEKRLGKEYVEYKRNVPMFIPQLRRRQL